MKYRSLTSLNIITGLTCSLICRYQTARRHTTVNKNYVTSQTSVVGMSRPPNGKTIPLHAIKAHVGVEA
jgi:hypothetical protein